MHKHQTTSLASRPTLQTLNTYNKPMQLNTYNHITTLKAHSSFVTTLIVVDDATAVLSASSDQKINLYPLKTPFQPPSTSFTITTTSSPIKSILLHNSTLFSSHQDHKIRAWKLIRHRNDHDNDAQLHQYNCKLVAVLPTTKDRLLSLLSPANYVKVRRHKKSTWVNHVDAVSGLAVSRDGELLYSVSWDRSLKVWRTSDFKCMESIANAHDDAINAVVICDDGYVYTASADTRIHVWRQRHEESSSRCEHELVQRLESHRSSVNTLALGSDGTVLYSGACDRSVVVWEGGRGRMAAVGALRGHTKAVLCLCVAGELVCSGSADRSVRVWRRDGNKCYSCFAVLEGHERAVKSLAMVRLNSSDCCSYVVFSGGLDCQIKVWRVLDTVECV